MALQVKVLTVSVSLESSTFDADLGTAIETAVLALGAPFTTSFDIISVTALQGGGRTAITGAENEAKTIKKQRYQVIVQG